MFKVLDWGFKISKFELQLGYYIHFQTNIVNKGMNLFILSTMG